MSAWQSGAYSSSPSRRYVSLSARITAPIVLFVFRSILSAFLRERPGSVLHKLVWVIL